MVFHVVFSLLADRIKCLSANPLFIKINNILDVLFCCPRVFSEVFDYKEEFIGLIRMDKLIDFSLEINETHILLFICTVKRKK